MFPFHVHYQENKAVVNIKDGEITQGSLPNKQTKLILAWCELHQDELLANWELSISGEQLFKIQPLQ
jgi:hypothetical protein